MKRILTCGLLLSGQGLLSGCAGTVVATAETLCKDWRHQTVSKSDQMTDGTASQIEASNKSRPAWGCAYGQNKAKS